MEQKPDFSISIVIIARNEEKQIAECIDSALKLDPLEILLIDDNSTDNTIANAKIKNKVRVIRHVKENFSELRNFAKDSCRGKWIFYIDADERVSDDLVNEINELKKNEIKFAAYEIKRINYYLGCKWPKLEYLVRFIKKERLIHWYGLLHETAKVNGNISRLNHPLLHYTHNNLSEMVENTINWSTIEANLRLEAKHPKIVEWRFLRVMVPIFWDYFIQQRGWQLGTVGLIESIYQMFSIFITYARLWELQQKN